MPVIREVLRLVGHVLGYARHQRSLALLAFLVVGGVLVLLLVALVTAAPVLVYPVL